MVITIQNIIKVPGMNFQTVCAISDMGIPSLYDRLDLH